MATKRGERPPGQNPANKEQEPGAEKPHQPIERLLDVGPGLPKEAKDILAHAANTLERYEFFAATFGEGEIKDKLALVELLEEEGVFSAAVTTDFENYARVMAGMVVAIKRRYRETPDNQKRAQKKYSEDQIAALNRANGSIEKRLTLDRRPLTKSLFVEAGHAATLLTLENEIAVDGFYEVWKRKKDTDQHLHWISIADNLKKIPRVERDPDESDYSCEEKLSLLRNAQFLPSERLTLPLPFTTTDGQRLRVAVQIFETTNAATVASFKIPIQGLTLDGSLSRSTGELHFANGLFISLKEHFRYAESQEQYAAVREAIIDGLFSAWESGTLQEATYLELEPDELTEIDEPSEAIVQEETGEGVTEEGASEEAHPLVATAPEATQTVTAIAPQEKKGKQRKQKYTWRGVMAALRRCGVTVDMAHAHPKLRFGEKVSGYLNSHDTDTKHVRNVLKDTLKDLGIPLATFREKLY